MAIHLTLPTRAPPWERGSTKGLGTFSLCSHYLRKRLQACLLFHLASRFIFYFYFYFLARFNGLLQHMAAQLLTVTEGIKKMNLEEAFILIAILILSKFPTFTVTRVINYISKTFGESVLIYKKILILLL